MIALPYRAVQCSGAAGPAEASTAASRSLMRHRLVVFDLCSSCFFLLARLSYLHVRTVLKSKSASYHNLFSTSDSIQNLGLVGLPNSNLDFVLVGNRIRTDDHNGTPSVTGGQEGRSRHNDCVCYSPRHDRHMHRTSGPKL